MASFMLLKEMGSLFVSGDAAAVIAAVRRDTALLGDPAANAAGKQTPLSVDPDGRLYVNTGVAAAGASELHIGQVTGAGAVITVSPTLDTSIYAADDLLFDQTAIAAALRVAAGTCILDSIVVLDEDDQGVAMDLVFLNAATSLGTFNAAPTISDANARTIISPPISIATADYIDLGGCRLAGLRNIGLRMKAAAASTTLYVAGITRGGTPTYTVAGLKFMFGFTQD